MTRRLWFRGEGGGGEIMDLPVVVEFYFCFSYLHFAVGLEELFVVGPCDFAQGITNNYENNCLK